MEFMLCQRLPACLPTVCLKKCCPICLSVTLAMFQMLNSNRQSLVTILDSISTDLSIRKTTCRTVLGRGRTVHKGRLGTVPPTVRRSTSATTAWLWLIFPQKAGAVLVSWWEGQTLGIPGIGHATGTHAVSIWLSWPGTTTSVPFFWKSSVLLHTWVFFFFLLS